MKISRTKPRANFQPQIDAYAATDTAIDPTRTSDLSLSNTRPNLARNAPTPASGASARLMRERRLVGSAGGVGVVGTGTGTHGSGGGAASHESSVMTPW